jgi:hypothetical protein
LANRARIITVYAERNHLAFSRCVPGCVQRAETRPEWSLPVWPVWSAWSVWLRLAVEGERHCKELYYRTANYLQCVQEWQPEQVRHTYPLPTTIYHLPTTGYQLPATSYQQPTPYNYPSSQLLAPSYQRPTATTATTANHQPAPTANCSTSSASGIISTR